MGTVAGVNQHALLGNARSFVLWLECRMEDIENGDILP